MPDTPTRNDLIHKQLIVDEVVEKLRYFTKLYGIESLFIAGGYCRSLHMGRLWEVNDIDVASAFHEQALQLGGLFASEVLNKAPEFYHRTGTAHVDYESEFGTIRIEFQGHSINAYMHNQEVREWMRAEGIDDTPLMNNIFGRDFTINSMIYSLNDDTLYDPTQKAKEDFKRKLIASLLPGEMLIKYNPIAILRAIRFSMQYGFHIAPDLRDAMKAGIDVLTRAISHDRIVKDVVKILKLDAVEGLKLLKKYSLDRILLDPSIKNYISLGGKDED